MAQITELAVMGIPGRVHSFVAKTGAAVGTWSLAAAQVLVDGAAAAQTRVDGTAISQVLVDGAVAAQSEPP